MKVPARVVGRACRKVESSLRVHRPHLALAHRRLFAPAVLAVLKASSCHVADAARKLPERGGTITAREDKLLNFIHSPKLKLESLKQAHVQRLKREFKGAMDGQGEMFPSSRRHLPCAALPSEDLNAAVHARRTRQPLAPPGTGRAHLRRRRAQRTVRGAGGARNPREGVR